jgi:hypothetical protein
MDKEPRALQREMLSGMECERCGRADHGVAVWVAANDMAESITHQWQFCRLCSKVIIGLATGLHIEGSKRRKQAIKAKKAKAGEVPRGSL